MLYSNRLRLRGAEKSDIPFNNMNLHRIFLRVFEHNVRGIRAYEHTGFIHEGRLRQDVFREGAYHDVLTMGVIRSEWRDEQF